MMRLIKYLTISMMLLIFCASLRSLDKGYADVITQIITHIRNKDTNGIRSFLSGPPGKGLPFYQIESEEFLEIPASAAAFKESALYAILFETKAARRFIKIKEASSFREAFLKGKIRDKCVKKCGERGMPFVIATYEKYEYQIFLSCESQNMSDCGIGYLEITHAGK